MRKERRLVKVERVEDGRARVHDTNERVAGNEREASECIFAVIVLEKRRIYTLGVFC